MLAVAVNVLFRTRYTDLCYGYNAFWRHCLPYMNVTCDGFEVETLIHVRIARAGLTVTEVGSVEHPRLHGESKLNARQRRDLRVLRTIVRERARQHRGARTHDAWRPSFRELAPDEAIAVSIQPGDGGMPVRVSRTQRRCSDRALTVLQGRQAMSRRARGLLEPCATATPQDPRIPAGRRDRVLPIT